MMIVGLERRRDRRGELGLESMYTLIATTLYITRSEEKDICLGTVAVIDWCEDTL